MPRRPNLAADLAPEDFPVDRKLPVADQLYRIVRQRIVELDLAPGSPITDSAIALAAGVSRTPAREAIKRLEDEGLIEIFPSQGSFITRISRRHVEEAIFLRESIEPEVAARCAKLSQPDALLSRLTEMLQRQRHAVEKNGGARIYGLDETFHKAMFEASDLPLSWSAIALARGQMDRIHYLGKLSDLVPRRALAQHEAIVEAIRRGDAPAARKAMRVHVATNRDILKTAAAAREEFFDDD